MSDDRRMTTDRFYGGVSNRLQNLRAMLAYVRDSTPSRSQLNSWVISNTPAGSENAVSHHLTFLESIELIDLSESDCELGDYGNQWLEDQSPETLYDALLSGVKGFDTILQALQDGPMTDEEIMDLLVNEFDEAEMTKSGPAIRHREWLQVLGYVERDNGINRLTPKGREMVEVGTTPQDSSELSVGDFLTQEDIEAAFDTGFGYRISGINPRRDEQDRRYILLFATEEGPYNDAVTQGLFEYIGEGLDGDQSEDSPGNSALIDARSSDIPIHFFYQRAGGPGWEYQGLVDVVDYEFQEQNGRDVLVFKMEHQKRASSKSNQKEINQLTKQPQIGEIFTAQVDRLSGSGNGIIEAEWGHINVGPVTQDSVGKVIKAEMVGAIFARCLTDSYKQESYDRLFNILKKPVKFERHKNLSKSTKTSGVPSVSTSTTDIVEFCNECGSIMRTTEGSWLCGFCGYTQKRKNQSSTQRSKQEDNETSELEGSQSEGVFESQYAETRHTQEQNGVKSGSLPKTKNDHKKGAKETTTQTPKPKLDIEHLRKRAEESAVESVPDDTSTTTTAKPQYNRSSEVKEYVKARADGVCEGCGDPAPFTSKTGKPYLHAHHIHELSDGGSDTPDTVIALCPNCHYRVHHGEDGNEYNQELLEIVQTKESQNI